MKPSLDQKPEWANYLAQDESGVWAWFEYKPKAQYANSGFWAVSKGKYMVAEQETNPLWVETLESL